MAVFDNRHTRRVAFLKVALPLVALAILSTLFLVADRRGTGNEVPFSSVEMDRLIVDQQISGPNYAAVTDDGGAVTVTARSVSPGAEGTQRGTAENLLATLEDPSGSRIDLSAPGGNFDPVTGDATLNQGVALRSSDGYRLEAEGFDLDAARMRVTSEGTVEGTGPPGDLTAGKLTVRREDGAYVLNFTDGVKLVYDPKAARGE
ncbi:lipopolysaccharide export system protein LptC [Palleronia salina]|uniref:Lipopolysaccharide export system protein LptC n=2 Tax=Palleronia TaxID=315422 RepID=A0A1M6CNA4_9RHOB|nr:MULTISPECIES: hypothetical protein [Palleronia]SEN22664.1 lipopolysaccharide export system protein LptC [Palleronia pelagia]SHI62331.1 lipopolysaccharide export system protein LptC [Palleronia salina]